MPKENEYSIEEEIADVMNGSEDEESSWADEDTGDTGQQQQQKADFEPFRFSDEKQAGQDQGGDTGSQDQAQVQGDDQEHIEIVHRGQVHRVTKEKAKELAQKGFDYDVKVGPHARIAQLIQADPELAKKVDQHVRQRLGQFQGQQQGQQGAQAQQGQQAGQQVPADLEIEPADKFDTDEEWLKANMQKAVQATVQQMTQQQQQQMQQGRQPQGLTPVQQMMLSRDPNHFYEVAPRIKEMAAKHLTVEQYNRINQDPQALMEFYDFARSQIVGQGNGDQGGQEQRRGKNAPFRMQSGGGEPKRSGGKDSDRYFWDMPNDEFEKELNKVKGF